MDRALGCWMPFDPKRDELTASQLVVDGHLRQEGRAEPGEHDALARFGVVELHQDARRGAGGSEVRDGDRVEVRAWVTHYQPRAREVLDADAAASGERMSAPDDRGHGLLEQRTRRPLGQRDELAAQCEL